MSKKVQHTQEERNYKNRNGIENSKTLFFPNSPPPCNAQQREATSSFRVPRSISLGSPSVMPNPIVLRRLLIHVRMEICVIKYVFRVRR